MSSFAQRVIQWQSQHGRQGLPWQGTRDAYRIWLSEIMLQQTQVRTVIPYYQRFLQRFPSVVDLAAAPLDEVMALWSGLGYYSRARNLHRCAQQVVSEHGGEFPTASAVLQNLPGIGPSTAAAIAAFSSGERAAILDGNVKRVLSRHLGFDADLARADAVKALWAMAQDRLPPSDMGIYTQGLMDLGAMLCTRSQPQCVPCPIASDCVAYAQGRPQHYPVKTKRLKRHQRQSTFVCLFRTDQDALQIALMRRPEQGIWAGLWCLPEWSGEEGWLKAMHDLGINAADYIAPWPDTLHTLTHVDWTLRWLVHRWPISGALPSGAQWSGCEWLTLQQACEKGLPAPVREVLVRLQRGGDEAEVL